MTDLHLTADQRPDHPRHAAFRSEHPLGVSADAAFPLLCPVREREWLDGWACELVHSRSGLVERGCVFTTDRPPEGPAIWVATVHDPAARRVEFVRISGAHLVVHLALRLEPVGPDRAVLHADYHLTGVDGAGRALVAAALRDGQPYGQMASVLGRPLEHFLVTGGLLRRGPTG